MAACRRPGKHVCAAQAAESDTNPAVQCHTQSSVASAACHKTLQSQAPLHNPGSTQQRSATHQLLCGPIACTAGCWVCTAALLVRPHTHWLRACLCWCVWVQEVAGSTVHQRAAACAGQRAQQIGSIVGVNRGGEPDCCMCLRSWWCLPDTCDVCTQHKSRKPRIRHQGVWPLRCCTCRNMPAWAVLCHPSVGAAARASDHWVAALLNGSANT
jgi:hypothetical protein